MKLQSTLIITGFSPLFSRRLLTREIEQSLQALRTALGRKDFIPTLFRPPYGIMSPAVKACTREAGLDIAWLTFFVRDADAGPTNWKPRLEKIKASLRTHQGGALVLHEMRYLVPSLSKQWLPEAVDELVKWTLSAGLQFGFYRDNS